MTLSVGRHERLESPSRRVGGQGRLRADRTESWRKVFAQDALR